MTLSPLHKTAPDPLALAPFLLHANQTEYSNMLRDGFFALQEFYKTQREREQVKSPDTDDELSMVDVHARTHRKGPIESISRSDFEALGSIIHPFWYTALHGLGNLRLAQREVKRWERSISFLTNEQPPHHSETVSTEYFNTAIDSCLIVLCIKAVLQNVLEIACGMLNSKNMHDLRWGVSSLFEPLTNWSACVVRTRAEHDNIHYAIARALVRMCKVMNEVGLSGLSQAQQDYIEECLEVAKLYIVHADNEALLDQEDFYDEEIEEDEASCPVANFRRLIISRCPADLFGTNQSI